MRSKLLFVVVLMLAVFVLAVFVTRELPSERKYEVRYEFRVRNYVKNVVGPDRVLGGIANRDSYWLCGYLKGLPEQEGLIRKIKYDKTEKVTLLIRGDDSIKVSEYGKELYSVACDTVTRYGDETCERMSEVLRREIATLPEVMSDSLQSLQKELYEMLALMETGIEGGVKYVELLNEDELPQSHLTPSRWVIIVVSELVALIFGVVVVVMKEMSRMGRKERKGDEGCR